jgi:hypothetical protein
MGWGKILAVVVASAIFIPVASPTAQTTWADLGEKDVCGARSGRIAIGTPDGQHFFLGVFTKKARGGQYRPVRFGASTFTMLFGKDSGGVSAPLSNAALAALATSANLSVEWPEDDPIQMDVGDIGGVINALASCGSKLTEKRVAQAEARARRAQALWAIGSVLRGAGSSSSPAPAESQPPAGRAPPHRAMCIKTGERISGVLKTCAYNCAGSLAFQTVGLAELCPLSISR